MSAFFPSLSVFFFFISSVDMYTMEDLVVKSSVSIGKEEGWGGGLSAATAAAAAAAAADPLFAFPPLLRTGEIAETHNVLRRKILACVRARVCFV